MSCPQMAGRSRAKIAAAEVKKLSALGCLRMSSWDATSYGWFELLAWVSFSMGLVGPEPYQ